MSALAGPFLAAAVLLGLGGALKARRPESTARALAAMRLPSSPLLVRAGGMAEVGVAAYALAWGNQVSAILVAASYLLFAGFVAAALVRKVPLSTCGCLGAEDTPPSVVHLIVNLGAALVAAAVAFGPGGGPGGGLGDLGQLTARGGGPASLLLQVVFLASVAGCAYLAWVALTLLPRTKAAARPRKGSA